MFRNEITDAKYGCLMVGAQPPEKNWLNERGFAIGEVFIAENRLENLQGDRGAFEVTGVERLHMYANEVQDQITFDGRWGINRHGIRTGEIRLTKQDQLNTHSYIMKGLPNRLLSRAEKMGMYGVMVLKAPEPNFLSAFLPFGVPALFAVPLSLAAGFAFTAAVLQLQLRAIALAASALALIAAAFLQQRFGCGSHAAAAAAASSRSSLRSGSFRLPPVDNLSPSSRRLFLVPVLLWLRFGAGGGVMAWVVP